MIADFFASRSLTGTDVLASAQSRRVEDFRTALTSGDDTALDLYATAQAAAYGDLDPSAGEAWPEALTAPGGVVRLPRRDALLGWRYFAVSDDGRLLAPFNAAAQPWTKGTNVASSARCSASVASHPSSDVACRCGLRAMRSRDLIDRFAELCSVQTGRAGAVARVAAYGTVAAYAPDDDHAGTLRASHMRLDGVLDLAPAHADVADLLAARYAVDVRVTPLRRAAGLLLAHDGRVLLQLRSHLVDNGGTWSLPGGSLDADEDALTGALRETFEEVTGLDLDGIDVTGEHISGNYTTITASYSGALDVAPRNAESDEVRWVPLAEVPSLDLHPALRAAWPSLAAFLT